MVRWLLILVISVVSTAARAQNPAPATAQVAAAAATTQAQLAAAEAERQLAALTAEQTRLAQRYEDELRAIDRLKKQRTSWRSQRELKELLAEGNETALRLAAVTRAVERATGALAARRRALIAAIDGELAAGATGARARELARLRHELAPQVARAPHRIVIPDTTVDPLADPEELDQQAAALREAEAELRRQVAGLDGRAQELDQIVAIRKQHDRAIDMDKRDDNSSRRTPSQGGGARPASVSEGKDTIGDGPPDPRSVPELRDMFEADAPIVLADVVDAGTLDSISRAQRSGDPEQRAAAAKKARDAVAARLEQIRQKRLQIEDRARRLRKH